VGYICGRGDVCAPPDGAAVESCPVNYSLCPASLKGGCCPNGMGCAISACYSTQPSTATVTQTVTTTQDGVPTTATVTATTVVVPSPPSVAPDLTATQAVAKFYPSYVPKVSPLSVTPDSNSSSGLTTPQIAGIVGGAVGLLIIVGVAAYIIIRHLNNVVRVVETNMNSSSGSKTRPPMNKFKPTGSEVDALSVDPLMISPRPAHRRYDSGSDVPPDSTPDIGTGSNGTPSPYHEYQPAPLGGSAVSDRHTSFDSAGHGSYFDVASGRFVHYTQQPTLGGTGTGTARQSTDSQGTTYNHLRHWSNASEYTNDGASPGVQSPHYVELDPTPFIPELPATPTTEAPGSPRRRSSGSIAPISSRPPLTQPPHRRSDAHARGRSDSSTGAPLGIVAETAEIHGHYGPSDRTIGQTAAGLNREDERNANDGPTPQQSQT
jgi:hypothetical protein